MDDTVANSFLRRYAKLGSRKRQRRRDARASKYKKDSITLSYKHDKQGSSLHQTKSTRAHARKNMKRAAPPHVTDKRLTLRGTVSTSPHLRGELMYEAKKKQSCHDLKYLLAAAKGHKLKKTYGVKHSKSNWHLNVTSDSSSDPDDLVPDENQSLSYDASLDSAHNADFFDNDEQVFRERELHILRTVNSKKLASKAFQPVRSPQRQKTARNEEFTSSDLYDKFSISDGYTSPQAAEKETHLAQNENCCRSLYKNVVSPEFPTIKYDDLSLTLNSTAAITNQLSFSTYLNYTIHLADSIKVETKKMFPGEIYFTEVKNSLQAIQRQGGNRNLECETIQNEFTEDREQADTNLCFPQASGERNGICMHPSDQLQNYPESHVLSSQDSFIMMDEGDIQRLKRLSENKVDAWLAAMSENSVNSHESTSAIKTQDRERHSSSQVNEKKQIKLGSPKYEKHLTEISNKKQFSGLHSISPLNKIDITSTNVAQHTCSTHFLQNAPFLNSFKDVRQSATAYVPASIEFLERTLGKNSKSTSCTKQNKPRRIEGIWGRNDLDSLHNMMNNKIKYSSQGSGRTRRLKTTHDDGSSLSRQRSVDFSVSSSEHLEMSNSLSVHKEEIHGHRSNTLQSDINVVDGYSSSSNDKETLLELLDIKPAQQAIQDSDPKNLPFYKLYPRKMY